MYRTRKSKSESFDQCRRPELLTPVGLNNRLWDVYNLFYVFNIIRMTKTILIMNLIINLQELIFFNWPILQMNDINRLPIFFSRKYVCLCFLLFPKPITFSPVQLFSVVQKNTSWYYNPEYSCLKSVFSKFSQTLISLSLLFYC